MSGISIQNLNDLKSYLEQRGSTWSDLVNSSEISGKLYKIIKDSDLTTLQDSYGDTLMHEVAFKGLTLLAEKLIGNTNINWNVQNRLGNTPLHRAAEMGSMALVSRLTAHKTIDQTILNNQRRFPVDEAYQNNRREITELFSQTPFMDQLRSGSIIQFDPPIERTQKFEDFNTFFRLNGLKVCVWGCKGTERHQFILNFLIKYFRTFHSDFNTCKWVKELPEKKYEDDQLIIFTPPEEIRFEPELLHKIKQLIVISRSAIQGLPDFVLGQLDPQVAQDFIFNNRVCDETDAEFIAKRLLYLPLALACIVRGPYLLDELAKNWNEELPKILKNQYSVLEALRDCAITILHTRGKQNLLYDSAMKIQCLFKEMYPELSGGLKKIA